MDNNNVSEYVMVKTKALPEVFLKVLNAKDLLSQGSADTVQEALDAVNLSRSAFYKYRDCICPIVEDKGKTVTLSICLMDLPGILSDILNIIANRSANILTINQTIPIDHLAYVTITIQTINMDCAMSFMLDELKSIKGVRSIKILSGE